METRTVCTTTTTTISILKQPTAVTNRARENGKG